MFTKTDDAFATFILGLITVMTILVGILFIQSNNQISDHLEQVRTDLLDGNKIKNQDWYELQPSHRYELLLELPEFRKFEKEYILE